MIEIIFSVIGIFVGALLGLVPGMNINNVLPFLISLRTFLLPHNLSILIVSMAISQIFVSYIPSIFVGAPEGEEALSVLPGHKLLLEGRAYEAIKIVSIGGILSLFLTILLIFSFANYFRAIYEYSRPYIHYAIISVIILMILTEKGIKKKVCALSIILLSGLLGIIALNSNLVNQRFILFPILTGLFGLSTIIISLTQKAKIPKQQIDEKIRIGKKQFIKSILIASIFGIVVGFLPAIGVSQAAIFAQYFLNMHDARTFLLTLSGIVTANEAFSLTSLYLVKNPRSGASVAIQYILPEMNFYHLILLIGCIIFSASISFLLTIFLAKKLQRFLEKVNYTLLSSLVIVFLVFAVFVITGIFGLLLLFTSTSIGLVCINLGVRRSNCMGVLLIPSILFFANLVPAILNFLKI